jgi:hypothetical protein
MSTRQEIGVTQKRQIWANDQPVQSVQQDNKMTTRGQHHQTDRGTQLHKTQKKL